MLNKWTNIQPITPCQVVEATDIKTVTIKAVDNLILSNWDKNYNTATITIEDILKNSIIPYNNYSEKAALGEIESFKALKNNAYINNLITFIHMAYTQVGWIVEVGHPERRTLTFKLP